MPATPALANRLKLYVSGGAGSTPSQGDAFIEECISEAVALVDHWTGTTYVPGAAPVAPVTVEYVPTAPPGLRSVYTFSRQGNLVTVTGVISSTDYDMGPSAGPVTVDVPVGFRMTGGFYSGADWYVNVAWNGSGPFKIGARAEKGKTVTRSFSYLTTEALPVELVRVSPVPAEVLERAYIETGADLYYRKQAPQGVSQFTSVDGAAIRLRRDPLDAVRPMLAPYLAGGFA